MNVLLNEPLSMVVKSIFYAVLNFNNIQLNTLRTLLKNPLFSLNVIDVLRRPSENYKCYFAIKLSSPHCNNELCQHDK